MRYPVLYHMATYGAWPSIRKYGLLGSSELVKLFEILPDRKIELIESQRKQGVKLSHHVHGEVTLRDQKPLSAKSLARCLVDCDASTWYRILNERVFFWLSPERLKTLMSASEYVDKSHTVLFIDTALLINRYQEQIELAHMNTGNTRPFPHKRGTETFRSLSDFPFESRRRLSNYSAIVELTVLRGVPDLFDFVIRAEHAAERNGIYEVEEVLFER